MSYDLPDGTSVSLWASGGNRAGQWVYFWTEFAREELPQVGYRVFPVGAVPGEWSAMQPAAAVFEQTGFEEEYEDEDEGAQLGAAARLAEGRYILQARIVMDGAPIELSGVTFEVEPEE